LELNFKMILRAFLAFYHHVSHKQRGGVNVLDPTLSVQFKNYRNSEYDPTKEITPWGLAISSNKGLSDWNKLVKPSARDFKPFREANGWVDYKDVFMITLKAQNLTHLVDTSYVVTDMDLHKAQQSFLHKVLQDNIIHHEAKSIVKSHSKTKDTALIWQLMCKTYDKSMSTSLNGNAILGWLTSTRLDNGKWNQTQGEHIAFYEDKVKKFNEMCPDSEINDMQGVRMLQNSIANVPNLANVLILYCQTKASAGLPDKITLCQFVALLSQQAQVYDNGRIRLGRNCRRSAANHELDYEINAYDVDQDEEEDLDEWFKANVMNQRDPKTGRYLGNRNGNKSTGFKKTQNNKRQANQMQGNQSRAFMNRETWNALGDSDKKAWDQLSDPAKTKITVYHFNKEKENAAQGSKVNQMEAKEHDLIFDDSDEEVEAKQHGLAFDDPEEEEETAVKVNNFETVQVSDADSTCKICEDEGVDFDMMLQAQQANTRIQVCTHELLDSGSSDEESAADLEVNMHNIRANIQGLLEFSNLEDENKQDPNRSANMDEVLDIDARGKVDDSDMPEDQSIKQKTTARMFEGMLQFSNSEDEEDEDKFQLRAYGFTSSIEETVNADGTDAFAGTGNEGIVGEQEGNLSSLTDSNTDRR